MDADEQERADADRVDEAARAVARGDLDAAMEHLRAVFANLPAAYSNSSEAPDGSVTVKFWDQRSFAHYVLWNNEHGTPRVVYWQKNAYPRALFQFGFILVAGGAYDRAIEILEMGERLEPTNPLFAMEKAHAIGRLGDWAGALSLYESIDAVGPFVSALDYAMALRGKGSALLELGRLDEAEAAYRKSLEVEPENRLAVSELVGIASLRAGGQMTLNPPVATKAPDFDRCIDCGTVVTSGIIILLNGTPQKICDACNQREG
jgi:tetratricopeptide (TPR) repeat protein